MTDTTTLWSYDPGRATGLAEGFYGPETPYTLRDVTVLHDGVEGVSDWYWTTAPNLGYPKGMHVIENFIVRPGQPADPIALEVIGFIKGITHADQRVMRLRSDKHFVPDAVLKANGLWFTGKQVNHTDGRDANDAIIHAISWLAFKMNHRPTLERYFPDVDH